MSFRSLKNIPDISLSRYRKFIDESGVGIYVFHPSVPGFPNARFPGVVVFSEIYQGR